MNMLAGRTANVVADPTAKEWGRAVVIAALFAALVVLATAAVGGGHNSYDGDDYEYTPMPKMPVIRQNAEPYTAPATDSNLSPLSVTLEPREDYYADVVFQNRLASGILTADEVIFYVEEGTVHVIMTPGDGDIPDVMTVVPPAGYYTIPKEITVEEDEIGIIQIHEMILG